MDCMTPLFRWLRPLPTAWLCLGLGACSAAPPGPGGAAHGVTEIAIERDCYGCDNAGRWLLRSDGSVVFTQVGKARHGTVDQVRRGRVEPAEFDALARLIVQRGFFQLQDRYEEPGLQDGAWTTVRAARGLQEKEVFVREDAAPPDLQAVQAAIDGLTSRVRGMRGMKE